MNHRCCRYCQQLFQPSRFRPHHFACTRSHCQRQRRREYRKLHTDAECHQVCRDNCSHGRRCWWPFLRRWKIAILAHPPSPFARVQNKGCASTDDLQLRRLLCGMAPPSRGATPTTQKEATLPGGAKPFRKAERPSRNESRNRQLIWTPVIPIILASTGTPTPKPSGAIGKVSAGAKLRLRAPRRPLFPAH